MLLNVRSAELEYGRKEIEENVVSGGGDWIFDRKCPERVLRLDLLPRHAEPVRVKPARSFQQTRLLPGTGSPSPLLVPHAYSKIHRPALLIPRNASSVLRL